MRFHILSDDLDAADKVLLKEIVARRENTEVRFYEPARLLSKELLAKIDLTLENRKNLTRVSYYRLLAADLLPPDVHRALYLDGDIVCTGSLGDLFEADLKGCACGMCLDLSQLHIYTYNRLNYPPEEGYFNAGVILFDLCLWREQNLSRTMFDYFTANAEKLMMHDQDLINAVLHGRILQLDFSYDVMPASFYVFYWLQEEKSNYLAYKEQSLPKDEWPAIRAAVESSRFVHFTRSKPWFKESSDPFTPIWRYFYAQSPWANEPLRWQNSQAHTAKARIKRLVRKTFEALHLVKKKRKPKGIPCPQEVHEIAQKVLDALHEEDRE